MDMRPARPTTRRMKAPQAGLFTPRRPMPPPDAPPGAATYASPVEGTAFEACRFAVIDLETTGVGAMDRVVEVGVVRFSGDGSESDQWSTLINPGRDLGVARVHGVLSYQDVRHAPRFEDVAGEVVERLAGAVVVAHNLQFEERFLGYEFRHLGLRIPAHPGICTLRLGCELGATSRRLDHLCRQFGIPLQNTHSALADAWSTARLLSVYLLGLRAVGRGSLEAIGCTTPQPPVEAWPRIPRTGMVFDRYQVESLPEHERPVAHRPFLSRVVHELPAGLDVDAAEYLDLLDRVVADHQVTLVEAEALRSFAEESGFDPGRCDQLHRAYFDGLVRTAWADGVLTDEERAQIQAIGALLAIDPDGIAQALAGA